MTTRLTNTFSTSMGQPLLMALVATLIGTLLAGCGNRQANRVEPTDSPVNAPIDDRGDWFCQAAEQGQTDPWECVQDPALAKDPKPDRLPAKPKPAIELPALPSGQNQAVPGPAPRPPQTDVPPPPNPPAPPSSAGVSGQGPPPDQPGPPQTANTAAVSPPDQPAAQPDYLRLAYQPNGPISILDLPDEFYAVQLAALQSADAVERFVSERKLQNLSAAKVAANGQDMYVLILGIYETRAIAEQATAQLPSELAEFSPWLRALGNLKQAMQAAQ